eukprot:CAMPEP_0202860616 /NCGR_PEP_ID=MMETSP1391-20130828/2266_1 /ASSEMBLY_ACC=CAM_ASM_000867 /TAXON_ID=1034604 /ORGANISM="Chlamydomonas leiostraca, Strain SAG 11-49" /LENGTH=203 /DNA_ID=CAMNT_0049539827 /DNA_START=68 /DNA_END=676 /DNA_ORIENTATION=+
MAPTRAALAFIATCCALLPAHALAAASRLQHHAAAQYHVSVLDSAPQPPVWPEQFHAVLFENRTNRLALVDLWYDWPGKRNLNAIHAQLGTRGGTLMDLEYDNRTSFYWRPKSRTCSTITFEVGILTPDWLSGATFLGQATINNMTVNTFTKADFITYWSEAAPPYRPVRWLFHTSDGQFEVMEWHEGVTMSDAEWQPPAYCF